jgi:hypothetical protein
LRAARVVGADVVGLGRAFIGAPLCIEEYTLFA